MVNTFNFTSKDTLNAISAQPLQSIKNKTITISGMAIDNRPDRDGQVVVVGYIKTSDGSIYTTISDTVIRGIDALIDYVVDEGVDTVDVKVATKKSKNNREFFVLEVI